MILFDIFLLEKLLESVKYNARNVVVHLLPGGRCSRSVVVGKRALCLVSTGAVVGLAIFLPGIFKGGTNLLDREREET